MIAQGGNGPLRRALDALTAGLNLIGSLLIFGLMLLIGADVIGRAAFGAPISGVPEIVTLSIVAIVFLQIPQAARMGRLTRSEAFLGWLSRRAPRAAIALEMLFDLVALAVVGLILEATWPLFVKSWERNSFVGAIGDFTAPVWPVKGIILIGCAMLMLRFVLRLGEGAARLRGRGGPGSGAGARAADGPHVPGASG